MCASCSRTPVAVRPAEIDTSEAAARMLAQYDADGNGTLSATEAAACAGIPRQFERYDSDGDGELNRSELVSRWEDWSADGAGVLRVGCRVTHDGKPLAGAVVALEPHPFLGPSLNRATGTTDVNGQCSLSVSPDDLPKELQRIRGVQPGLYVVHITHANVEVPARFNSESMLGLEVATDTIGPEGVEFAISSR